MITKKRTTIIAAFPGVGKTCFYSNNKDTVLDSDSSNFSWVKDEKGNNTDVRNPNFINDYMTYIKENIGKYDYILTSSHAAVREALYLNLLDYVLVIPPLNQREEYCNRYKERNSPESFIKLLRDNWDSWLADCMNSTQSRIIVCSTNLEDLINNYGAFHDKKEVPSITYQLNVKELLS